MPCHAIHRKGAPAGGQPAPRPWRAWLHHGTLLYQAQSHLLFCSTLRCGGVYAVCSKSDQEGFDQGVIQCSSFDLMLMHDVTVLHCRWQRAAGDASKQAAKLQAEAKAAAAQSDTAQAAAMQAKHLAACLKMTTVHLQAAASPAQVYRHCHFKGRTILLLLLLLMLFCCCCCGSVAAAQLCCFSAAAQLLLLCCCCSAATTADLFLLLLLLLLLLICSSCC